MPRKRNNPLPTIEDVQRLYSYDPETGVFTHVKGTQKNPPGSVAGIKCKQGDIKLVVNGVANQAQEIAWFMTYGAYPERRVRHVDGNPSNNRLSNLYMMPAPGLVDQKTLKAFLSYDQETGQFIWLRTVGRFGKKGQIAGHLDESEGYIRIGLNGRPYKAHRLAWLYVYGHWPRYEIDHINRNRSDNRIANLRDASDGENARNASIRVDNKTGYKGVCFDKSTCKYLATIQAHRKLTRLGLFNTPEEAHAAYVKAARELHGEFANY